MATENILMDAVRAGGNRQELHERIRQHSIAAGKAVKEEGKSNDMIDRIAADPAFGLTKEQIMKNLRPEAYIGCCPEQVTELIENYVQPMREKYADLLTEQAYDLKV
jgi:adenylosuccinate lyase